MAVAEDLPDVSWDFFFYADQLPIIDEIDADLLLGLLQRIGTLLFNREDGTEIPNEEQRPFTAFKAIMLRNSIINFIGRRNTEVSDGTINDRDYRVAASQTSIEFQQPKPGDLDAFVGYFRLIDLEFSTVKAAA